MQYLMITILMKKLLAIREKTKNKNKYDSFDIFIKTNRQFYTKDVPPKYYDEYRERKEIIALWSNMDLVSKEQKIDNIFTAINLGG